MKRFIKNIILIAVLFIVINVLLQLFNTAIVNAAEKGTKTLDDGTYIIKSAVNEKYVLDVYDNSKVDGANLELWTNHDADNQKFTLKYLGDGAYSISPVHSKKCIDVEGDSKKMGTNVLQWVSNNQNNQKWIIKEVEKGYYKVISKSSGMCLDIPYSQANAGANVQVWVDNGGRNQMFKFEKQTNETPIIPKGTKTIDDGIYSIKTAINQSFVFDIYDNSKADGANLELWINNSGYNQMFIIKYLGDGSYSISPTHSSKSIDVEGDSKQMGANVLQWTCNNQNNQKWIIQDAGKGYYNIISKSSGMYLDIPESKVGYGANVQVWVGNGGKNQMFKFENVNKVPNIDTKKYPGYKEKIQSLIQKHPNWHFELLYTGLDFNTVVNGECALHSRNLVPSNYTGEWICSTCGNKLYDSGWYCTSKKAVAYYMDPRNFLNEKNIFQFQNINQYNGEITLSEIKSQVKGTYLQNYANDIYNACKNKGVNTYYIISRLIQEQGRNGTTIGKGMDGGDGKKYYNPFDIGASGNGYDEIYANALATAKKYKWTTMKKAIEGGIDFCKQNWLDNYQNTLYQNKFDIDLRSGASLYTHQYMQNLMGAYSEATLLRGMYVNTNKLDSYMTFIIPVYENMPSTLSPLPEK